MIVTVLRQRQWCNIEFFSYHERMIYQRVHDVDETEVIKTNAIEESIRLASFRCHLFSYWAIFMDRDEF